MNNHLEYIVKKCAEANPEIMELKFGCRVKCSDYEEFPNEIRNYAGRIYNSETDHMENRVEKSGKLYKMDIKYEILGKDPELSDVLLAISKSKSDLENFTVHAHGSMGWEKEFCIWNLLKPLSLQSPETWEFIFNLLQ